MGDFRLGGKDTAGPPELPSGFLLQWHITERCNLSCGHCYQAPGPRPEVDFHTLTALLEQFSSFLKLPVKAGGSKIRGHVTVTGGEPFLRDDFPRLLETLVAYRDEFGFAVLTNGSLMDDRTARWLARQRPAFVQVSLDGGRETHDRLRGHGDFDRTSAAIGHMVKHGIRVFVSFTANAMNYLEFGHVAKIAEKLGVSRVWSDRMLPMGRGKDQPPLSPAQTRAWLNAMLTARKRAKRRFWQKTEVAMHRSLQFLAAGGRPYRCTAGRTHLALLPDGTLVPCRRMPIPVGNLLQTTLADIYRKNKLLNALRDQGRMAAICPGCPHAKDCAGGLRCMALAVTGDCMAQDPGCPLAERAGPDSGCTALEEAL